MPSKKHPCHCPNCKGAQRDIRTVKKHGERSELLAQAVQRDIEEHENHRLTLLQAGEGDKDNENENEDWSNSQTNEAQASQQGQLSPSVSERPSKRRRFESDPCLEDSGDENMVGHVNASQVQMIKCLFVHLDGFQWI